MIVSLFVTTEHGIMIQDHFPLEEDNSQMIGVHVPYYYIYSHVSTVSASHVVTKQPSRKFMQHCFNADPFPLIRKAATNSRHKVNSLGRRKNKPTMTAIPTCRS